MSPTANFSAIIEIVLDYSIEAFFRIFPVGARKSFCLFTKRGNNNDSTDSRRVSKVKYISKNFPN